MEISAKKEKKSLLNQNYRDKMSDFQAKFEQITSISSAFVESKMLPQFVEISSDHSAFLEADGEKVITKCDKAIKAFNTSGLLKDRHVDDCIKVEPEGKSKKEMEKVRKMPIDELIARKEELERLVGVMTAQIECRDAFKSAQTHEFVKVLVRKVQAKRGVADGGESETFKKMRTDAQNAGFSLDSSISHHSGGGGASLAGGGGASLAGGGRGGASPRDLGENGEELRDQMQQLSEPFSVPDVQTDSPKACDSCGRVSSFAHLHVVSNPHGTSSATDFLAVCGDCAVDPAYN